MPSSLRSPVRPAWIAGRKSLAGCLGAEAGEGDGGRDHVGYASGPLKIMYRVDGTSDLVEETLQHAGSRI
jgi:hypothetical protein